MNNSNWRERFDKQFFQDLSRSTNGDNFIHYWRDVAIKNFISSLLEEERQGLEKRLDEYFRGLIIMPDCQASLPILKEALGLTKKE